MRKPWGITKWNCSIAIRRAEKKRDYDRALEYSYKLVERYPKEGAYELQLHKFKVLKAKRDLELIPDLLRKFQADESDETREELRRQIFQLLRSAETDLGNLNDAVRKMRQAVVKVLPSPPLSGDGDDSDPMRPEDVRELTGSRYQEIKKFKGADHGNVFLCKKSGGQAWRLLKILSTRNPLDQQEIANHSKLNDSGLAPKILDRLTEYNFCFIEMEYIKALSLKQYMEREGDLHPDEAMKIMSQVCETIHEIHQRDIIHRDLKPSHILLNPTGETGSRKFPVILDFGISLDVKSRQDPVWKDTWPYTAPEILRERIHDHRVDVFSLGVIFKEVLGWTGQAPPPADLDRKLRDICRKAVAEDPAQRFASARDFAKAITAFREAPSVEIGKGGERRARMRHIHAGNRTVQNCTLRDFLVDPFPVTAREFLKFADSGYLDPASESVRPRRMRRIWTQTGLKWLQEHSSFRERRPALEEDPDEWAHSISWVEAAAFCNWLTIRESCPDFLDGPAGNEERFKKSLGLLYYRERSPWSGQRPGGYRLPMEFELVCAEKEINAPEDGHELTTDCFLGKPHLEGYAQRSNPVVFVDFGHSKTLVRLGNHRDRTSASPRSVPHIRTHFRCARTAK